MKRFKTKIELMNKGTKIKSMSADTDRVLIGAEDKIGRGERAGKKEEVLEEIKEARASTWTDEGAFVGLKMTDYSPFSHVITYYNKELYNDVLKNEFKREWFPEGLTAEEFKYLQESLKTLDRNIGPSDDLDSLLGDKLSLMIEWLLDQAEQIKSQTAIDQLNIVWPLLQSKIGVDGEATDEEVLDKIGEDFGEKNKEEAPPEEVNPAEPVAPENMARPSPVTTKETPAKTPEDNVPEWVKELEAKEKAEAHIADEGKVPDWVTENTPPMSAEQAGGWESAPPAAADDAKPGEETTVEPPAEEPSAPSSASVEPTHDDALTDFFSNLINETEV